jgi:hypothetical protein
MTCLHPYCPMAAGLANWTDVVNDPRLSVNPNERVGLLTQLNTLALNIIGNAYPLQITNRQLLKRLLEWLPCLYTQINKPTSAKAIVHLCEITLGVRINSANVNNAFIIQNPSDSSITFSIPPQFHRGAAGDISEALCSEVLTNEGLPELPIGADGWPILNHGHISLNKGKMIEVKAFGDILIPCAPSNLIISVKTQAAKERLLYSANMIEGVGFGFFNDPSEFWTPSRMNLFKRMGFTAIYLPDRVHREIIAELQRRGRISLAINVNGRDLYRPLSRFGSEMVHIAGKHTLDL